MKIIHLTDLHLVPDGRSLYGLDPRARLEAAVADINRAHADAAAVVITGDLTHDGDEGAYRVLRDALAPLRPPVHLVAGNHDDRAALRRVFPEVAVDDAGYLQSVVPLPGARLVLLDSRRNDAGHGGLLCAGRLAWLDAILGAEDTPALLALHHPPMASGIVAMDAIAMEGAEDLAALIARHAGRVRHLFLGHLHRAMTGTWQGVGFSVLPGLNHQVALSLEATPDVVGCLEPPAYGVALVGAAGVTVHHHAFLEAAVSPRFWLTDPDAAAAPDVAALRAVEVPAGPAPGGR